VQFSKEQTTEARMSDGTPVWDEPGNLEARYANCFKVGYNAFELVFDFGQVTGSSDKAMLNSRIVINPRSATMLYEILGQTLVEYERMFGKILREEDLGDVYGALRYKPDTGSLSAESAAKRPQPASLF
jgi:hypothetical protein